MYKEDTPHFHSVWKLLKNPIVRRPIVAGYKWILTKASIFVGHCLKEFYTKFEKYFNGQLKRNYLLTYLTIQPQRQLATYNKANFNSLIFVF